ncbi:APC family permease [Lysobacter korlensis]|uniref:APC family permease n=1 Tax=Lysobacter korlensis TaxID=553636 RepID=A0ABV6RVP1_9GAMM
MQHLERRLGLGSAIWIGLASMIGAGVFFVWAPAAAAAGELMLVSLAIAAVVACLNALSTAQLAMRHPIAGGAYSFGRETIGPWTGFTAGWLFLWGKTASVGAIALIAGSYLWPESARLVAVGLVAFFAGVNMTGIRSTAAVSAVLATIVLVGLFAFVLGIRFSGGTWASVSAVERIDAYGVLQGAALIFFAFAGYARMATLGEEVRNPRRTLPLAILLALAIALFVYANVAILCLTLLGPTTLAATDSPLAALLGGPWDPAIRTVAGIACLGSLVGILAALSRTSLAMARNRDLPGALARISTRTRAPVLAEAVTAFLAIVGVLLLPPETLVGLSNCAVLAYYGVAHAAAYRQPANERWLPRAVQIAGLVGCAALALSLPLGAVVTTLAVLGSGLVIRFLTLRVRG